MNQHDRSAQCKRIGHSLILGAPIRKVGGIDGQHHARLFDDPLIGQKLGVRLLMEVDAVQFRASREHIEVALPKLRRPFGSLLLMGYDADQPKGFILLPQNINATYLRQIEAGTKVPSLQVFVLLCEALRVSPTYLLAEVLPSMEFSDMDVLLELWQTATPKQIAMMSSMIRSALEASKD